MSRVSPVPRSRAATTFPASTSATGRLAVHVLADPSRGTVVGSSSRPRRRPGSRDGGCRGSRPPRSSRRSVPPSAGRRSTIPAGSGGPATVLGRGASRTAGTGRGRGTLVGITARRAEAAEQPGRRHARAREEPAPGPGGSPRPAVDRNPVCDPAASSRCMTTGSPTRATAASARTRWCPRGRRRRRWPCSRRRR